MREKLERYVRNAKRVHPIRGIGEGVEGYYVFPFQGFQAIVSNGCEWDHVSISILGVILPTKTFN